MNSLRARLLVGVGLLLALGLAVMGWLAWRQILRQVEKAALQMAGDKAWIRARTINPDSPTFAAWMLHPWGFDQHYTALFDKEGRRLGGTTNAPYELPINPRFLQTREPYLRFQTELVQEPEPAAVGVYPVYYVRGGHHVSAWSQAIVPLRFWEKDLHDFQRNLWLTGLFAWLAGMSLIAFIASGWLRTALSLGEAAQQIDFANFNKQRLFLAKEAPEFQPLVERFNGLLDRLSEVRELHQHFMADAAHELRTPIAATRAELEVALRRDRSAPEYQAVIEGARHELQRLSSLVDNLLVLARVDAGRLELRQSPVNISEVCRDVADHLQPIAAAAQVRLRLDVPDELLVNGEVEALSRILRNLVENAIRYSPAGEEVAIRARPEAGLARVEIADRGVGIDSVHLPRLFDRFYRVDTARSRAHGGAGLGLSIVKELTRSHGGSVEVQSELGKGATFIVRLRRTLPKDSAAPASHSAPASARPS